jgi:predicted secreted hydrolase
MRQTALSLLAPLALATPAWLLVACGDRTIPREEPALTIEELLGGPPPQGFERALEPRELVFPADHGPHPGFATEWWYFTGVLASGGRTFGYELTVFRKALEPEPQPRESAWAASQIYLAHFALSDVGAGRFRAYERSSRAALDLAGARAEPFRVWVESWSAEGAAGRTFPLRLRAAREECSIDLVLDPLMPPVLHGERGLSRKGAAPGNASYYYSIPRLATSGELRFAGERFQVEGLSWMDREWGTSALEPGTLGWDWFGLRLDDGRDLMLVRLRREDGGADPASSGTLVEADGTSRALAHADFDLDVLGTWTSPHSGARYPSRWRIRVPREGIDLELEPLLEDQELRLSVRYWEGAVRATGSARGKPLKAEGYVELTGY